VVDYSTACNMARLQAVAHFKAETTNVKTTGGEEQIVLAPLMVCPLTFRRAWCGAVNG
jgi:hypothetical protein